MDFFKKYRIGLILSAIAVIVIGIVFWITARKTKEEEPEEEQVMEKEPDQSKAATTARLYNHLIQIGIPREMALIIIAQALHESGNYKSSLAVKYNNLFGMKQPLQRDTKSIGATPNGYASFNSIEDSVDDLLLWLNAREMPEPMVNVKDYAAFIKSKGYYEDSFTNYNAAMQKHYNSIKYLS